MEARPAVSAAVALLLVVVGCSGSAAPAIPEDPGPSREDIAPAEPPPDVGGSSGAPKDADAGRSDASVHDAASEDAGHVSACETCVAKDCKTERDACLADTTCKLLSACLDACKDTSCRNACFTKYPDPGAKAKNGALYKCQCIVACATACTAECRS